MKTLWMTLGFAKTILKWIKEVREQGKQRLSKEQAKADRLALERVANWMRKGAVDKLPRSLRWVSKWLHKLGVLDDLGDYLTALLKSEKLDRDDTELYRMR